MKRRAFVTVALSAAALAAARPALFPAQAVAGVRVRPRADRAWLYGAPGGCAGFVQDLLREEGP